MISDVQHDPEWVRFPETNWIRSYLLAPILVEKQVIGVIALNHDKPDFFSEKDKERLMAFANQAASAIENARLFEEESRRARIIEALAEIANVVATTRDTATAMDEIARRSLELLNARDIAIYLLQDDNTTLKIVTAKGAYQDTLLSHTIQVGQGITGHILETGKAEIVTDARLLKKFWQEPFGFFFAGGPSDPDYCLLKITPKKIEYLDPGLTVYQTRVRTIITM